MSGGRYFPEHSEAKVKLYSRYLSIYLNVLSRTFVKNIYLFDLFCGEGIYEDGGQGSPIAALETIKRHYFSNGQKCPNLFLMFNDTGYSEVEPNKKKIVRASEFSNKIFRPENVQVGFTDIDYSKIIGKVIERTSKLTKDERSLVFIDPCGYKEIKPDDIKKLLENGKTEVLLFLPIYFMSRFAKKAKDEEFKGGHALRKFIGELFGSIDNLPAYKSQNEFIFFIQEEFKKFLKMQYVDSFKIERDNNQWFSLFFFTNNQKGFLKMLESKWSIDKKHGSGFKLGDDLMLDIFDEITLSQYDKKVFDFLKQNKEITNTDLRNFGLEHNFLPKHTKQVLDEISKSHKIEIISLDGKPARSYYIPDENRLVKIKLK